MKKLFIFIMSVGLLASCSWNNSETPATPTAPVAPVSKSGSFEQDLAITSSKIKSTPEFQECMKQNTNMCIQSVGMQVAQKTKDASFCKELNTPEQKSSCEFAVVMLTASEKNDDSLCTTLADKSYQTQCKISIARQKATSSHDVKMCASLSDIIAQSGTGMEQQAQMEKDQCMMMVIMSGTGAKVDDCNQLGTGSIEMCKMQIKNRIEMMEAQKDKMPLPPPAPQK